MNTKQIGIKLKENLGLQYFFIPTKKNDEVSMLKPLDKFKENGTPIFVVSFASPYELSGLVYLLHYNSLLPDNLVITGFYSGCGSIFTNSMKLIQEGQKKAVWGVHDISARARLPKDIMTLSMLFSIGS